MAETSDTTIKWIKCDDEVECKSSTITLIDTLNNLGVLIENNDEIFSAIDDQQAQATTSEANVESTVRLTNNDEHSVCDEDTVAEVVSEIVSNTLRNVQNEFIIVNKTKPIIEDVMRFTTRSTANIKGKMSQLKNEEITTGIYAKKSGFISHRPLDWAIALEKMTVELQMDSRWDYACDDEKYTEIIVKILPTNHKRVTVEIKLTSGVVLLTGTNHQEWIAVMFEPWKSTMETGTFDPASIFEEVKQRPTTRLQKEDDSSEIAILWEENESLKNSLLNLENAVSQISEENKKITTLLVNQRTEYELNLKKIVTAYDEKIAGFLLAAESSCDNKVASCLSTTNCNIEKVKQQMNKQDSKIQNNVVQIRNLMEKKPVDEPSPSWIDVENISKKCTSEQLDYIYTRINSISEVQQAKPSRIDVENISKKCMSEQLDCINTRMNSISEIQQANPPNLDLRRLENEVKLLQQNLTTIKEKMDNSSSNIQNFRQQTSPDRDSRSHIGNRAGWGSSGMMHQLPDRDSNRPRKNDPRYDIPITDRNIKVLVCMDSNGKRLDKKKFWTLNGTIWKTTYRIEHVQKVLELCQESTIDTILISVGTNDVDNKTGHEAAKDIAALVDSILAERPQIKIAISEATPRSRERDNEIVMCNNKLHELLDNKQNVFLATQSNLRDSTWSNFDDDKHVSTRNPRSIPVFAKNLKAALRKAVNAHRVTEETTPYLQNLVTPTRSKSYPPPPINERLQHISQNSSNQTKHISQHSSNQTKSTNLLIEKLGDVIKCLQMW